MTLFDFCDSWFWPEYVMTELAPRTRSGYATQLDRRIIPHFGNIPIRQIRRRDIKKWRNELLAAGESASVINATIAVLRSILSQALEEEVIDNHPAMRLKPLPEVRSINRDARDPMVVERVRAAIADEEDLAPADADERKAYVSLLEHGLRPSEASALRFGDVIAPSGAPRGTILVARAASGDRDEPFKATKNNQRREVVFHDFAQQELLALWEARQKPDRSELIFSQPDGRPWHNPTHYYIEWWNAALARAGVTPFVIYDLRHTAASYQLLTMKHAEVARQLGHSVATNQKTYDHPLGREADRWRGMSYDTIIRTARAEVAAERATPPLRDAA
jgi:integrase